MIPSQRTNPAGRFGKLPLALFMAWIVADNAHDAAAPDDLAVLADALDAGSHFHDAPRRRRNRKLGL